MGWMRHETRPNIIENGNNDRENDSSEFRVIFPGSTLKHKCGSQDSVDKMEPT